MGYSMCTHATQYFSLHVEDDRTVTVVVYTVLYTTYSAVPLPVDLYVLPP